MERDPDTLVDAGVVKSAMRYSTLEGLFAAQYMATTTSALLVGFLLALGASVTQVGYAAALPMLGGIFQPLGAELIRRRKGWRRGICVSGVLIDDLLWIISILGVAFLPTSKALILVLVLLGVQQIPVHASLLAWQSWVSDLIPPRVRGRYFGTRNFTVNSFGAIVGILAGQFVEHIGDSTLWSFMAVIVFGMTGRAISAFILNKQPEPVPASMGVDRPLARFADPFNHQHYRQYLRFISRWEFAAQLAAPFFIVYMLRELGIGIGFVTLAAGFATLANLLSQQYWGNLCDYFGNRQILRTTCLVLVAEPLLWFFASPSSAGLAAISLIHVTAGFASGGFLLANGNLMMGLAPRDGQTSFFAVQAAIRGLSAAASPIIGGLLLDKVLSETVPTEALVSPFLVLFTLSFFLRLFGYLALKKVPEESIVPRLHLSVLISEFGRSFTSTHGFGLLLQGFTIEPNLDSKTIEDALRDHEAASPTEPHQL